jgi:predicted Zn-dependent protease
VKTLKATLALCLAAALFAGCAKTANNTNGTTTTTTTTTNNASSKVSTPAATPMPSMPTMPTGTPTTTGGDTASSSSGAGETFTNSQAGVQFTLPAGWNTKAEGETITATSEHDAISVVLWVPRGDDFSKATEDLKRQLEQVIKNPQVTTPGQETTHNGMRAYTAAGTGDVNGETIIWEVDILQAKKPFFVLTFAAPQMFKMHQAEYQQLLASIKPVG